MLLFLAEQTVQDDNTAYAHNKIHIHPEHQRDQKGATVGANITLSPILVRGYQIVKTPNQRAKRFPSLFLEQGVGGNEKKRDIFHSYHKTVNTQRRLGNWQSHSKKDQRNTHQYRHSPYPKLLIGRRRKKWRGETVHIATKYQKSGTKYKILGKSQFHL